jgi:ankyrin repeat protein
VQLLIAHGASVLARSPAQDMALHWAALKGSSTIVQELLAAGADVNGVGDAGNRPLHLAAAADQLEVRLPLGRRHPRQRQVTYR